MRLLSAISVRNESKMNKLFVYILTFTLLGTALAQSPNMNFTGDALEESANNRMNLVNGANQTGGAWYPQQFDLDSSFFLDIAFGSNGDAEGWAIVLYQGDSMPTGLGAEQLGVPTGGVSFITEFDFQPSASLTDPPEHHVSFFKNGSLSHLSVLQDNVLIPDLDVSGDSIRVSWDPVALEFAVLKSPNCTNSDILYSADIKNTVFGGDSKVYIGFTASTSAVADSVFISQHYNSEGVNESETICEGESVTLHSYNGVPMQWVDMGTLDTTCCAQEFVVSPTVSTYYKIVQSGFCYTGFRTLDSIYVEVHPKPNLVITDPAPVCSPSTIDLSAAAIVAGSTFAGGSLSTFVDAEATIPLTTPWAVDSGVYYISTTSSDGCTDIAQINAVVNPSPTLVITDPTPVYSPLTVDLTGADVTVGSDLSGGSLAYYDNATATSVYATPATAESGAYYVVATTSELCTDTAEVNVVVIETLSLLTDQDYFSPNGDGEDEIITIRVQGESKIVNSAGQILRYKFEGDVWDGTDQYGVLQTSGVYIIIGETGHQTITLLR